MLKNDPPVQLNTEQKSTEESVASPTACTQLVGTKPVWNNVPAPQISMIASSFFFVLDIQLTPKRKAPGQTPTA